MEITEVRIKLIENSDDRLQAFCSITFDDCFVIRDLKIIEGLNGPFVAMPSRKLTSHCFQCGSKNHLRAVYCNQCGARLSGDRQVREEDGRTKLYADIAHPINSSCRETIQNRVISEYLRELELAKQPGYVSRYEEDFDDELHDSPEPAAFQLSPSDKRVAATGSTRSVEVENVPGPSSPPPPHISTSAQPAQHSNRPSARKRNDDFGAGVF